MEVSNAKCALQVRDLKLAFGEKEILRGVSFDVYEDELLGVMGTSGGGKSTILKSIIGLMKPDSGQIWFEGVDLTDLSERDLYSIRSRIAFVFQDGALFDSLTVEENLSYPLRLHTKWPDSRIREEVNRRLEQFQLKGSNSLYPSQLSGGMAKRIGLIRATMMRPRVALLDEPTAGLDPALVARFVRIVKEVRKRERPCGMFVTHDKDAAFAVCDRIAVLHQGVIRTIGTPEELDRSSDPVIREIFHPDFGDPPRVAA